MNKGFLKFIRQVHLWIGLASGLVVFIISITGFLYVFEEEIRDFTRKEYLHVASQQKPFIGLKAVLENFEDHAPKQKISAVKVNLQEANGSVQITTKKKQVYYYNPYTAELINKGSADWLNVVLEIHTSLLLGETGKQIQGWTVVIFLIALFTGLVLWFPKRRRLIGQSLKIKWPASAKRLTFDLHQVLGFYSSIFLILIAFSGTYFAFQGSKQLVSFVTASKLNEGIKIPVRSKAPTVALPVMYDKIYNQMIVEYPGANSVSFSVRKNGELRLRMTYPYKWARIQNTFFYDSLTGQLIRYKLNKDQNAADLYEAANHELHTGAFFGLPGKILWSLVSLISASLPVTGFLIWYKKQRKRK